MTLYARDGISQEEITRKVLIDKGTTARAIQKLVKEGYVKKEQNPNDKRAYKVFLTEKAFQVKPVLKEISARITDILSSGFTEEEKEAAWFTLDSMAKNAIACLNEDAERKIITGGRHGPGKIT
jgi:DNA-binding MarR family transcriptional regulator